MTAQAFSKHNLHYLQPSSLAGEEGRSSTAAPKFSTTETLNRGQITTNIDKIRRKWLKNDFKYATTERCYDRISYDPSWNCEYILLCFLYFLSILCEVHDPTYHDVVFIVHYHSLLLLSLVSHQYTGGTVCAVILFWEL